MNDMRIQLEKLRTYAAECASTSSVATDLQKRELFARLAEHLGVLASEIERAIARQAGSVAFEDNVLDKRKGPP